MKPKVIIYISIVFLSVLILLPSLGNAETSIIINEIMYNPEGADNGGKVSDGTYFSHEWVEIFNASSQPIDLTDWRFNDGSNHVLNPPPEKNGQGSITIQPGEYAILTDDAATFLAAHPEFSRTVIDTVMSLNNTSDTLSLIDPDGVAIDSIAYQNTWGADGNGYTLEKTDVLGSSDSANWHESSILGGTPGRDNSSEDAGSNQNQENEPPQEEPPDSDLSPPANQEANNPPKAKAGADKTDVAIGENITFDASGSSDVDEDELNFNWNFGDENRSQEKTVTHSYDEEGTYNVVLLVSDSELESYDFLTITVMEPHYSDQVFINEFIPNPAGSDTDNEWVELKNESDEEVNLAGWQFDDEEGGSNPFTIPEGTVISANLFLVLTRPQTKIALNNDGDQVRLIWPNGFVMHEVSYEEKVKEGWSAARFASNWQWTSSPTPGSENILSQAETSSPTTKSSKVSETKSDPDKSTLKSTVSSFEENVAKNEENESTTEEVEKTNQDGNAQPLPKTQTAEARKAFSFSSIKYFTIALAIIIAFSSAATLYFLKKKLKSIL